MIILEEKMGEVFKKTVIMNKSEKDDKILIMQKSVGHVRKKFNFKTADILANDRKKL